ncbi:MAG: short-chain dehydrogenase/reductase [Phenylobacterium sp.]|uniref:oxidoreductase n=1 Tax=Phenylobacterium sp. TaxID=1871053 RepID=UPI00262E08D1|nr:oxidoreductase [Phenylobacterium sp.]MDB5435281.1 short-chain dehydrogenase/reductase [Phenylobacterium sp.]MDB5496113.1 short-chain dehydrogenase/reductase [Phenylobacterium sp.]
MANWLITGVGGGLGRALAKAALDAGHQVAGTVRQPAALADFETLAPGRARGFLADMADEASVKAAVEQAETALGGLDVLVNNAGYGLVGAIEESSLAEIRAQFEVNVFGPVAAIQAVLPHFRRRGGGHIINITSVSGLAAWAGTGIYCGSKHALEGIGRTLAQEVAGFGIKVTNVEPGGMRTDYAGRSLTVTARKIADYADTAHNAERILGEHAGHEAGDPARIAAAILKIAASPEPPVQLLLGADAVHYATQAMASFQEEFGRWAALSLSTGFADS